MSTSPSWFDQEKFSRLVKKVGPKNLSEPPPAAPAPSPVAPPSTPAPAPTPSASQRLPPPPSPSASQPLPPSTVSEPIRAPSSSQPLPAAPSASQRLPQPQNGPSLVEEATVENLASTTRISLVSKPPSLLSEHRALPALPRRTTPLPGLKSLFQTPEEGEKTVEEPAAAAPVAEMPVVITQPLPEAPAAKAEPKSEPEKALAETDALLAEPKSIDTPEAEEEDDDDLAGIWQKMSLLNEELAQTIQERDHAVSDINLLREQLQQADDEIAKLKDQPAPDEIATITRERDAALAELKALKEKAPGPDTTKLNLPDGISTTKELVFLTQERDQARKEYAELRKQFEMFKREKSPGIGAAPNMRDDAGKFRQDMEQQLEGLRAQLEEKNREIAALKAQPPAAPAPSSTAGSAGDDKLKAEIAALKEQLTKAKEDASIAQRGLALSQKALQETRDTLREATEGTSLSRHNFDNLKNECAALSQQITVLQAQNEQLARELAATKVRQSGRLPS